MTTEQVIDGILAREGGFVNKKADHGGATKYGITARTLGLWRGYGRAATVSEVQALTEDEARRYYRERVIGTSPFTAVTYEPLRVQLIDFGINSGNDRAVRWLQRAMGLPPASNVLTPALLGRVNALPGVLVNNALVAARLRMVDDWTDGAADQKQFEEGVESRALAFFVDGGTQ